MIDCSKKDIETTYTGLHPYPSEHLDSSNNCKDCKGLPMDISYYTFKPLTRPASFSDIEPVFS